MNKQKLYQGTSTPDVVNTSPITLRRRLARRQRTKAELEHRIRAAEDRYDEEICPLKEEVLRLRVEHLRRAAQRHMRSARHRNAYHDAQRAYETFQGEQASSPPPPPGDIKELYRQASKQCHPDVVPDSYREDAAGTFQALEAAYEGGHPRAVAAIAQALERWGFPGVQPSGPEETEDPREVDHLRRAVSELDTSIRSLENSDLYQALDEVDTLDAFVRSQKEKLLLYLQELRRR